MASLQDINFGLASAEDEATEHPELLLDGHFPYYPGGDYVFDSKEYLIIGYKGSGKSTIAHHTSLKNSGHFNRFVTVVDIANLPFSSIGNIFGESNDINIKYVQAWEWLLLLQIYDSWYTDKLIRCSHPQAWINTTSALASKGLLRDFDLNNIAFKTLSYEFGSKISELALSFKVSPSSSTSGQIYGITSYLKDLSKLIATNSKHIIFIDGLDDTDYEMGEIPSIVSSLISSIRNINRVLRQSDSNTKIVFLCRTDILDSVSRKNINKSIQDFSFELDWYHDPRKTYDSMLVKLLDKRVEHSLGEGYSIRDFIPSQINNTPTLKFALRLTRHTPRDTTRLFHYIQKHSGTYATEQQILSGFRSYSKKYLQREVRDELGDYLDPDLVTLVFNSIGSVGRRRFHPAVLKREISRYINIGDETYWDVLRKLFDCGAIGNIKDMPGGDKRFYFKFRNRDRNVSMTDDLIVHEGLFKAFDIV